jgi:hypothetical protein
LFKESLSVIVFLVLFALLLPSGSAAQSINPVSKNGIKPEERLVLSDSVLFMGIDLSVLKVINASPQKATHLREKYMDEWPHLGQTMCKEHNLKYEFSKRKLFCKPEMFEKSYEQQDSGWIIAAYKGITAEELASHIKAYPTVSDHRLGFVFVVDRMDGNTMGHISMYGVYINLSDNSVLKAIKCSGTGEGLGAGRYWGDAIDAAYSEFMTSNQNYLHKLKEKFHKKKTAKKKKKK